MKKLYSEEEADEVIKESSYLIGKSYSQGEQVVTVIELSKKSAKSGLFEIWVITDSPFTDELQNVQLSWPHHL